MWCNKNREGAADAVCVCACDVENAGWRVFWKVDISLGNFWRGTLCVPCEVSRGVLVNRHPKDKTINVMWTEEKRCV